MNLINTSMFGLTDINDGAVSIGLFEFGFGKDGLHSQIGMGGTDLNLGKLASSLNGVSALYQNKKINEYTQTHKDIEANVAMRALFSYGDKNGRDTYEDILSGKTTLAVNDKLEENATAKTVMNSDGTKTIFLRSLSNNVTEGVAAGIVLQHEAYRDGVDSADQSAETHAAVTGHTEMAIRVRDDGMYVNAIRNNENLAKDIENYEAGSEAFKTYAKQYDSSGDYWRVTLDEKGKIAKVQDDGDKDHITIVTASGEKTIIDRDQSVTLSAQMAQINGDTSEEGKRAINNLMWESGLNYTDTQGWHARNEDGVYTKTYLDYAYPGIAQKQATEMDRQREVASLSNKQETKKNYINQKEVGEKLGLDGNSTCLVATWMNAYQNEGMAIDKIYSVVKNEIPDSIEERSAWIKDQTTLSESLAKGLYGDNYKGKFLQSPWIDGKQVLFQNKDDFFNSNYNYGVFEYVNTVSGTNHYTLGINQNRVELDSWPGGIGAVWGKNYRLNQIRPLGWYGR